MPNDKYELAPWMKIAESYLGTTEISGSRHNPVILKFFKESGHAQIRDDETPWCSAFTNGVLYEAGMIGTKNLMARSWLNWKHGDKVINPRFGDIAIFKRGNSQVYGHVAFFISWDDKYVYVLGGNQSNSVTRTRIPRSNLLGFRRPNASAYGTTQIPKITNKREITIRPEEAIAGGASAVAASQSAVGFAVFVVVALVLIYVIWKRS